METFNVRDAARGCAELRRMAFTASTRQPLGVIRDDADMRPFFFRLMHESNWGSPATLICSFDP